MLMICVVGYIIIHVVRQFNQGERFGQAALSQGHQG